MSLTFLVFADLLPKTIGPYVGLMVGGFALAVIGHLTRARWLVAVGIMVIFLSTLIFPLARIATESDPPPADDPIQEAIP